MKKEGVRGFLIEHAGKDPVSFHMPGHKGAGLYRRFGYEEFLKGFFDCDITEITGADNLFQPEGIIAETMEKYSRLYDTEKSYLLVNGTSGGLIASIMASVPPGKKIILARNCHKAVFNALRLGRVQPVYAYPEEIEEYGIAGPVDPEEIRRLLAREPDAKAVILPSPNYYGICSDIEAIARVVHEAGKILIVDQAHGAHLKFFEKAGDFGGADREVAGTTSDTELPMPLSAETGGADLVVNSTHKTLGSLTQSAVLNVCRGGVFAGNAGEEGSGDDSKDILAENLYRLEDRLQAIESTSPSYILMGSLDVNADILEEHGEELIQEWRENLTRFYREAGKISGLKIMGIPAGETAEQKIDKDPAQAGINMDLTKINLDMSGCGLDGSALEEELLKREIYAELVTGNILMCMTGIGNTRKDYQRLLQALKEIAARSEVESDGGSSAGETCGSGEAGGAPVGIDPPSIPWTARRTLAPIPMDTELVPLGECVGRICGASIIPYPPGIPLVCPGEVIEEDDITAVRELRSRGEKVIGIDPQGRIPVGKQA